MAKLKVFIAPQYTKPDCAEGGIRRVVEAQARHLLEFGVELVAEPGQADITAGHGVLRPVEQGKPFVSHCHGLYWNDYQWANWAHEVNLAVTEAMCQAEAVTAPSQWVAGAITRGMLIRPTVIYHGVDADEWAHHNAPGDYVLWNKGRADPVSNPADMQRLAAHMPKTHFISTLGQPAHNVDICGVQPLPEMRPVIQKAGVYLVTARETMGIGTLEALAAGVPVAGWRYGGQAEIIVDGETGYLAPYGNYEALAECVRRCFAERERLSANCVDDARARWQWPDKIRQYAELYQRVASGWYTWRPKVTVIVTCYNLAKFLPETLLSVQASTLKNYECLIVDDCSTDNSAEVALNFCDTDPEHFRYERTPENGGLCKALNFGAEKARGQYLVNLDADNLLTPYALELQAQALDEHRELDIVFGRLQTISEGNPEPKDSEWPVRDFDFRWQMAHLNCIHSSAMLRREVREETGGYRVRMWRAEDSELWCRATSFGFRAAKITDYPTMIYRFRPDSKGQLEYREHADRDGDWTAWFPWRLAGTPEQGMDIINRNVELPERLVPWGAQVRRKGKFFWDVRHHQHPLISVIIPLGPRHVDKVIDALDSLIAQSFQEWEAIVVNNTGKPLHEIPGAPYARIVDSPAPEVGAARNAGIEAARGPLLYFLDADDYLLPGDSLFKMLKHYAETEAAYIYTDYIRVEKGKDGKGLIETPAQNPDYDQHQWKGQHGVNILIAKEDAIRVGAFDSELRGWEDWDFACRMAINGLCGKRLPEPTFYYRFDTGTRRESNSSKERELLPIIRARYQRAYEGDGITMASCCGGNANALIAAKRAVMHAINAEKEEAGFWTHPAGDIPAGIAAKQESGLTPNFVRLEYLGKNVGSITFYGKEGRAYRGGNNHKDRFVDALPEDAEILAKSRSWRIVPRQEPIPEPIVIMPTAPDAPPSAPPAPTVSLAEPETIVEPIEYKPAELQAVKPIIQGAPKVEAKPKTRRGRPKKVIA